LRDVREDRAGLRRFEVPGDVLGEVGLQGVVDRPDPRGLEVEVDREWIVLEKICRPAGRKRADPAVQEHTTWYRRPLALEVALDEDHERAARDLVLPGARTLRAAATGEAVAPAALSDPALGP